MGRDIGVVTGEIKYLDRGLFRENEDLDELLTDLLASGVSEDGGHSFIFLSAEKWARWMSAP